MLFYYGLELHLGQKAFVDFLRLLVRKRLAELEAMLQLISENYPNELSDWVWHLLPN